MKIKCNDCGTTFEDTSPFANKLNCRVWCNSCVDKRYKEFKKKFKQDDMGRITDRRG